MKSIKEIVESVSPSINESTELLGKATETALMSGVRKNNVNDTIKLLSESFEVLKETDLKGRPLSLLVQFYLSTYDMLIKKSIIKALEKESDVKNQAPVQIKPDPIESKPIELGPAKTVVSMPMPSIDQFSHTLHYAKDKLCQTDEEKVLLDKLLGRVVVLKRKQAFSAGNLK